MTSEANGIRVLLTADGRIAGVSHTERLPYVARGGTRQGCVHVVPSASRVTIWAGKEQVAAACVKAHCYCVNFDQLNPLMFKTVTCR